MSHQPTFLPNNICMESTTTEGVPVAEGLPEETNAIGTQEKRQRQKHTGVEDGQGSIGGAGNVQYSPKCQNAS